MVKAITTRLHYRGGQHTLSKHTSSHFTFSPQNTSSQKPLYLPGCSKSCIFSNYTTLPLLVKSCFKEQAQEHPGMIQTSHCCMALASHHLLPKGLVKPGKLPSMLTGACR